MINHLRLNRNTKAEVFTEKIRLLHNDDENGMQIISLTNAEFSRLVAAVKSTEATCLDTFAKQCEKGQ